MKKIQYDISAHIIANFLKLNHNKYSILLEVQYCTVFYCKFSSMSTVWVCILCFWSKDGNSIGRNIVLHFLSLLAVFQNRKIILQQSKLFNVNCSWLIFVHRYHSVQLTWHTRRLVSFRVAQVAQAQAWSPADARTNHAIGASERR